MPQTVAQGLWDNDESSPHLIPESSRRAPKPQGTSPLLPEGFQLVEVHSELKS